ncbi:MAG: hypothetical protein V3V00_12255 [Saprospiraceae bacterium]
MPILFDRKVLFIVATIIIGIIYGQTYSFDYVLDDKIVFTENSYVQKGISGIADLLTSESFEGYFGSQQNLLPGARYRPLSLVTYAIEHQFLRTNSKWSHLINAILYLCCIMLIFNTLRYCFGPIIQNKIVMFSAIGSFIFMIHPIHVEAIANVKGRDEILILMFSLWALFYSFKYVDTSKIKYIFLSATAFFMALLSKENALTFLAVIPMSLLLLRSLDLKKWLVVSTFLIVPTLLYMGMRYNAVGYILGMTQATDIMNNPFIGMSLDNKYATIAHTLLLYLKLSIFPHPLTHDYYPYHIPIMTWSNIASIVSVIIHFGMGFLAIFTWKKQRVLAWSIFFYLLTLSIVSNLFLGVGTFMNERFLFVSSLGSSVFMAYCLMQMIAHKNRNVVYSGYFLILLLSVFYIGKSIQRVPDWENGFTLNSSAVKVSKNSARANLFMGTSYFTRYQKEQKLAEKQANLRQAEYYISRSFEILPTYHNAARMKAGVAAEKYKNDNNLPSLLSSFYEIGKRAPETSFLHEYLKYLNGIPSHVPEMVGFYKKLGYEELYKNQNRKEWAARFLLYASKINENDKGTYLALSEVYKSLNRPQETMYYLQKAQNAPDQE